MALGKLNGAFELEKEMRDGLVIKEREKAHKFTVTFCLILSEDAISFFAKARVFNEVACPDPFIKLFSVVDLRGG